MPSRVLLCSLDGVRPDALQMADAPAIHGLASEGAVSWTARTVMPCCTLPCHTSMLRGVDTPRHGITDNTFHPLVRPVPSLLEAASAAGKKTAFYYNWEQLRDLAAPGTLHASAMLGIQASAESDRELAALAIRQLERMDLDLLFIYFGFPDEIAHKTGWMSQPYLDAIANADRCLSQVLAALRRLGRADETTTLVIADHGGHERSHGTEMDEDMLIPWVLHGPGVKSGYTIPSQVMIYDTCPTLAHVLGLEQSPAWEGRVVEEALL